jgi:hypothetical protein
MSAPPESGPLLQEEDRVSRLHVLAAMAAVLAISATMVVWAWATTDQVTAARRPTRDYPEERLTPRSGPPGTNELLYGQPGAGERLNAREHRSLTTYRWLDPGRRIVTLPIDQAMDRIAGESTK